MTVRTVGSCFLCLVACSLTWGLVTFSEASAQEWTRFRGPNGDGHGVAPNLPVSWTLEDYAWSQELPGEGHASPVLWGTKLFTTSADPESGLRMILALDALDGKILWTYEVEADSNRKHRKNSFASATPAVDADHVYVTFADREHNYLIAVSHEGQLVWKRDLGPFLGGHGSANSPIVFKDMVILGNDQEAESNLFAFDRLTGDTRWKVPRTSDRATYSTPCIYQPDSDSPEVIFTDWQQGITSVDAATGEVNWEVNVWDKSNKRAIGSPVVTPNLVIGTCGFFMGKRYLTVVRPPQSPLAAIDPASKEAEEVYTLDRYIPHIPTPLIENDLVFLWGDRGVSSCYRLSDGKKVWVERVDGEYFGSPVLIEDRLYALSSEGEVVVLAASEEFEILARNPIGEASQSTPAVALNRVFFRTVSHLYCLASPEAPSREELSQQE
ncbi:Serine/threonine protein kinase [Planctomycetales bacterium 10988]|nr:Serine/threonine protein kinase [Planctomycetales bacterium 10988]